MFFKIILINSPLTPSLPRKEGEQANIQCITPPLCRAERGPEGEFMPINQLFWNLFSNFMKWAILNAGFENILDYRYRPYSSGIVAPGRNFIVSLRISI